MDTAPGANVGRQHGGALGRMAGFEPALPTSPKAPHCTLSGYRPQYQGGACSVPAEQVNEYHLPQSQRASKQGPFPAGAPPVSSTFTLPTPTLVPAQQEAHRFSWPTDLVQKEVSSDSPPTSRGPGATLLHLPFAPAAHRKEPSPAYPAALPAGPPSSPQHLQALNPLSREPQICPRATRKGRMASQSWALKHEEE